jgi:hypothetical protein
MKSFPVGLGPALLLLTSLVGTVNSTYAGTVVDVAFSGTGVTGYFEYDQSKTCTTPPPNSGVFSYSAPTPVHGVCSTLTGSTQECAMNGQCTTFTITTPAGLGGGTTFKLVSTYTTSAGLTQIVIQLTTVSTINGTSLPLCAAFASGSTMASGTFVKTVGGVQKANCAITVSGCTTPGARGIEPVTPAVAPSLPIPVCGYCPPPPTVYVYAAPAPRLLYVCQPRQTCCLSRLICRGSIRLCCH